MKNKNQFFKKITAIMVEIKVHPFDLTSDDIDSFKV